MFITHGVADMVREVRFTTHNSSSLMSGASALLFVAPTTTVAKNIQSKAPMWDNALQGNVWSSMEEFFQLLTIDSGPHQVDCVVEE